MLLSWFEGPCGFFHRRVATRSRSERATDFRALLQVALFVGISFLTRAIAVALVYDFQREALQNVLLKIPVVGADWAFCEAPQLIRPKESNGPNHCLPNYPKRRVTLCPD